MLNIGFYNPRILLQLLHIIWEYTSKRELQHLCSKFCLRGCKWRYGCRYKENLHPIPNSHVLGKILWIYNSIDFIVVFF
jgi:hypothetical protein